MLLPSTELAARCAPCPVLCRGMPGACSLLHFEIRRVAPPKLRLAGLFLKEKPGFQALPQCGITVILMRFHFDERKSARLRANPKRGVGFEEVQEVFSPHTTLTSARIVPSSTERSAGWKKGCTLLFLR